MKSVSLLAVEALTSVLEEENQSLEALDFTAASRFFARKQSAVLALATVGPADDPPSLGAIAALRDAAAANRILLERAIAVQGRVLGILAQAARASGPVHYGACGTHAVSRTPHAFALSARA
jgi:flagellar biosynthesis/type III secretory pathway chaperone